MPKGEHFDSKHQSAAAMANIAPRAPRGAAKARKPNESLEEASLRLQRARADTEELDARKRQVELEAMQRRLIPASDAQDAIERAHLAWVAELEQLSTAVCTAIGVSMPLEHREAARRIINEECDAIRRRIAGA